MKMSKVMVLAVTAMLCAATPITAFAKESEEVAIDITGEVIKGAAEKDTTKVVPKEIAEAAGSVSGNSVETTGTEEESLPYSYTIKEDGSIVFSFNGEEYVYGEEEPDMGEVVNCYRLNMRTGAGMDFDIIDRLNPGEEVEVIGTEGDWYKIIVPAKTGYVHSNYLAVLESATNETDEALLKMFMMMFMDMINRETAMGPLTPDGNMNLIDDYGSPTGEGKQFITLTTKNGNYFYLIIDRDDKGNETVHFMNLVDESDLLALMEEAEVEQYLAETAKPTDAPVAVEGQDEQKEASETPEPTEPDEKEKGKLNPVVVLPLLIIIGGGGIALAMQMKKKKAAQEERPDPDLNYEDDTMQDYMAEEEVYDLPDEAFEEEEED